MDMVKCARCGAKILGYTLHDGRVYGLQSEEIFANTWVWGCRYCSP